MIKGDSYQRVQATHLGLEPVLAYHCNRCNYRWFPKNQEILEFDGLVNVKPPNRCARCKNRYWRSERTRKPRIAPIGISLSRIRSLIKSGKTENIDLAINLIGQIDKQEYDNLLGQVKKDMEPKKVQKFKEIVSLRYASKPQELETFKLPI